MADLLEKLWPAFISEVTEQLDTVELILAKRDAHKHLDVNQVFRNFHTIKGSCSMIGFTSMEEIAHRSEDILAAIRTQELLLDESVIDILLEAISCLKKQFHTSSQSRENPKQDPVLLERLQTFLKEKLAQPDTAQHDQEQSLDALVKAAKMAVPVMVLGLDPNAKVAQVESAVLAMANAALQAQLRPLSNALRHYIALLKAPHDDKYTILIEQLGEIFELLYLLSQELKVDLYLDMGARLCAAKLASSYQHALNTLNGLFEQLLHSAPSEWQAEQFLGIVSLCNQLSHYGALFKQQQLLHSFRYIRQLVVEVSRGYLVFNTAIIEKIIALNQLAADKQVFSIGNDAYAQQCQALREELQTLTAKHNNERDEITELKQAIITRSSLCLDSLVDLHINVLNKIFTGIEQGLLAVEIDIDFSDEQTSEKVLKAVQTLGDLVHSRTMFHDVVNGVAQRTSFSFLILSQKTRQDIQTILSIIDRSQRTFVLLDKQEGIEESAVIEAHAAIDERETSLAPAPEEASDEEFTTSSLAAETALSLSSLKVEGSAIDKVIDDVGELVTHHSRLSHLINHQELPWHLAHLKALLKDKGEQGQNVYHFIEELVASLSSSNETLQMSLSRIQNSILDLRVVPVAYVFNRFHGFVRSTAQRLGKKVVLELVGEQVRIDKGMIDILSEPLAHIVRNSIDHGIETPDERKRKGKSETGLIELRAIEHSEMVTIEIQDDGAGLDKERILSTCIERGLLQKDVQYTDQEIYKQIFEPGFSTSQVLTETSGRGVGMDVVKSKITQVGGTATVTSTPEEGTLIRLRLPVSATIQSVVLIQSHGQTLALPERHVMQVLSVAAKDIQLIQEQSAIMLQETIVPIYRLGELLQFAETVPPQTHYEVLILSNEQSMIGLLVSEVIGRSEVLVRDVHESLKYMPGVSAASILGDGQIVIILDCAGLFDLALKNAQNVLALNTLD